MASETSPTGAAGSVGSHPLDRLGHSIRHRPWLVLGIWLVIVLIAVLPAANVGKVFSGSFSSPLPSGDESVRAQNAFAAQFPSAQGSPASEIVLLEGTDITGPAGKNATLAITGTLEHDRTLKNVSSVESLYSAYEGYLVGEARLGWGFLSGALATNPSLTTSVNETSAAIWGPPAAYLAIWQEVAANLSNGSSPTAADWPAYEQADAEFASGSLPAAVLSDFYNGSGAGSVGFNASMNAGCLADHDVATCASDAVASGVGPALPTLFSAAGALLPAQLVLEDLGLSNFTDLATQRPIAATVLGSEVGLSPAWLLTIWNAFPGDTEPTAGAISGWADGLVTNDSIGAFPLPIPSALYRSFVDPAGSSELVIVSYGVDDTYTANGSSVTFADAARVQHDVGQVLTSTPSYGGITAYETGGTPFDSATTYLATSALGLLLGLTIVVLLVIMLLYFRAPAAPALAFGMIGIALVVNLAVVYVVGTYVTSFNSEIESIVLVFLMSIGTDYSVFLLARYREELVRGTAPGDAAETTVRWAGQSISTSGIAVMVVAVALALSGISFLSELGIALFLSVLFALLVNLTVLPAILVLAGPKVFWPNSGARFSRYAQRRTERIASHRDPIARAGQIATTRPLAVIGLILLISVPIVAVALEVPVSYDITNIGLPASNPAEVGYVHLTNNFGASYSSPSFVLVTFQSPVLTGGDPNPPVFADINGLADVMNGTPGIASVDSLVGGTGGTSLGTWLNFTSLPAAARTGLNGTFASYIGSDGHTVVFNLQTTGSGYSETATSVLDDLRNRVGAYEAAHPGTTQTYYGGAAPTTEDIQSLVTHAEEQMIIGAAIGLIVIMILILGSAFVPLLALGVIGLSMLWSWAGTYFVVGILEGEALIFLLPLILIILVLGLGMDYNVLLLTRVQEERIRGNRGTAAIKDAVTHAGGVITAAAVILGGAFLLLGFTSPLGLLAAIGLGIGFAVLLQAFVVQLFFTPAVLTVGKDAIWKGWQRRR